MSNKLFPPPDNLLNCNLLNYYLCRYEQEIRQLREINSSAETRLLEERTKKELIDIELRQLDEELRYVREDLSQQKIQSLGRIQQLEAELVKVRNQLTSKHNNSSTPSQDELEQR